MRIPLLWRAGSKRIRVDIVTDGVGRKHAVKPPGEGVFQLRYWQDGKLKYVTLKNLDPYAVVIEASIQRRKLEQQQRPKEPGRGTVNSAAEAYLTRMKRDHPPAAKQLEYTFKYLLPMVGKLPVSAVLGRDVEAFHNKLRSLGMSERTVKNHHRLLKMFFNHCKVVIPDMPKAPKTGKRLLSIGLCLRLGQALSAWSLPARSLL